MKKRFFLLPVLMMALLCACAAQSGEIQSESVTQQDIFADAEGILAVVVYAPTEEELAAVTPAGAEGSALQILDDSDGVYYDELLIVPRFGDCKLTVEEVEFDEETGAFVPTGQVLGGMDGTGSDPSQAVGGLLIRSLLPEGIPNKQVVVSRGDRTGAFLLGYDGKGDGIYYIRTGDGA